ncbi:recombinase family protein [Amycolatopsis minnesotensis]
MTRTVISPVQAIIYLRLSELRDDDLNENGDGKTFSSREKKLRDLADRLGWEVVKVIIENDINRKNGKARNASAFKRRKVTLPDGTTAMRVVRPGFQETLRLLKAGHANGILAEDLDRTMRDPRDLEDFIDIAEEQKVNARSLSGSLTFTDGGTDAEIQMARTMVMVANAHSRATSRRVTQGMERLARNGQWKGGGRPFGFEADGVTQIPAEADVVRHYSERLLQLNRGTGKLWSLRSLAAELQEGNVTPVSGCRWTGTILRNVLRRPRNAGISTYRGEEVGRLPGTPIVDEATFRAIARLLADRSRICGGAPPQWLGSGIYLCGIHADGTKCQIGQSGVPLKSGEYARRYICSEQNHIGRNAVNLDTYVQATLINRIARDPDFVESFIPRPSQPDVDTVALQSEAAAIRVNLDGLAEDRALGLITRDQMLSGTKMAQDRLMKINRLLTTAIVESPLTSLVGIDDVDAMWATQPMSVKRFAVDTLMEVTVHVSGRRGRGFHPDTIDLRFRTPDELEDAT